jgi:hypothetical protein
VGIVAYTLAERFGEYARRVSSAIESFEAVERIRVALAGAADALGGVVRGRRGR